MEPVRSVSEEESLRDMRWPQIPGVPQQLLKPHPKESPGLAWHRGHQVGVFDAYLTIKDKYPRVAKQLRDAFNMNEDGSITL